MKKSTRATRHSKAALTAAALAIPMLGAPIDAAAQKTPTKPTVRPSGTVAVKGMTTRSIKITSDVQLVGVDNGNVVYRNKAGELFYLDGATGDMKFITSTSPALKTVAVAHKDRLSIKLADKDLVGVTIIGTDEKGNLLHRNAQGDVFYLDATNGDLVYTAR